MTSRLGHLTRHHPMCPKCGYDLVATVAADRSVCPECGYEFEPHELHRQVQKGEWTTARGLGRASVHLLGRAVPCLALWTGVLWGVMALAAYLSAGRHPRVAGVAYIVGFIVLMVPCVVVGKVMARRMDEIAGMVSVVVAGLVTVAAWIVILAGATIVSLCSTLGGDGMNGATAIACGTVMAIIIKTHFFEDY